MSGYLLIIIAALCMTVGYCFKVKRWALFINVYETPHNANLLSALSISQTINSFIPFRIGDLFRIIWAGKQLHNGFSFSIATVFADCYADLMTVGIIFSIAVILNTEISTSIVIAESYIIFFISAIPCTILALLLKKLIKKIILFFAEIFNEKIEFGFLYITYLCMASIKDIVRHISKTKFFIYTAGMWSSYCISYFIFSSAMVHFGRAYLPSEIFSILFSNFNLLKIDASIAGIWGIYTILPLIFCFALSRYLKKDKTQQENNFKFVLPMLNQIDKMSFLRTYYEDEDKEKIKAYLVLNQDVAIVEDFSAGSNASTLLVMKNNGQLYFRKYAFNKDGEKLQEQIDWIQRHNINIPLPYISEQKKGTNYVSYDMPCYVGVSTMFKYIHTAPVGTAWKILSIALNDLYTGLYSKNIQLANISSIENYIQSKVLKSIKVILSAPYICELEKKQILTVNGTQLKTLSFYQDMLSLEKLTKIFSQDIYSEIHGDLTIENIVCLLDNSDIDPLDYEGTFLPNHYYFIDPNTGNIHNSPFLDYAKLLQSLHGNYEFFLKVSSVEIEEDKISYLIIKSDQYSRLNKKYSDWLNEKFSKEQVISIYYHEVIHWLRLLPYKIKKIGKLSVVFYTGLLFVLNDVWRLTNDYKK